MLGVSTRVIGSAVILAFLSANVFLHRLPAWVAALYLVAGIGSFLLYRSDKRASVEGGWRKPELRLHLVDLIFGIVGGLFAQHVLRHKTYKATFVTETALITVVHILMLGFILFGVYAPGPVGDYFRNFSIPG